MKQRLADYVAGFLVTRGVTDVFTVVGGGAMHLNDALGHHPSLHVTYNHHEQACAISAEAYARLENRIAAVCVTTGPGGWDECPDRRSLQLVSLLTLVVTVPLNFLLNKLWAF